MPAMIEAQSDAQAHTAELPATAGHALRLDLRWARVVQSAAELPHMVESAVASVAGVREVKVNLVWDPPWDPSRMSDEARLVLNMW